MASKASPSTGMGSGEWGMGRAVALSRDLVGFADRPLAADLPGADPIPHSPFPHSQLHLPVKFAPLAHAQVAEEVLAAPVAQFRLGQFLVRLGVGAPQVEHADEVGLGVGEHLVRGIGLAALVGGAFARVLHAEEGHDGQQRVERIESPGLDEHARQLHVDGQPRQFAADIGQRAVLVDRLQLGQAAVAVGQGAGLGGLQEREILHFAESQTQHAQDHVGQRGAQQFRIGEARPAVEIGLVIQAHADAWPHAAAASLALVGGGARDSLHVQALELAALAVAIHARHAGVDHVADARHGQRGLGHVGGQYHAPRRAGMEHAVLLLGRQPRVQRHHFGVAVVAARQDAVRIADLALTGQEHQHVAARVLGGDLVQRQGDVLGAALLHVLARAGHGLHRPPAHLDRIGAALDLDHRRTVEVRGEARGVDGGRGDDDLEIGALGRQALQVPEQEIDVQAALVRLVDDQRVVGAQPRIALRLGQQNAVGHELDQAVLAHLLGEAHLEADHLANARAQLLGHAPRHRARRQPARLGAADQARRATAGRQAQLGQLGGLARAGLTGDDHHLVSANGA